MADLETDILIVGGGLVGALMMLALRGLGYQALLIDEKPQEHFFEEDFDARSIALSPASIEVLKMLQLWPDLEQYVTPIQVVHVSQQGAFGCTRIEQQDKLTILGCVIELKHLSQILHAKIKAQEKLIPAQLLHLNQAQKTVTILTQSGQMTLKTKLLIAADGANSSIRQKCNMPVACKSYEQHAIVANIGLARPHKNIAYERFTSNGPIALLPVSEQRSALVWAWSSDKVAHYMNMDDQAFLKELQTTFGYRLGRFLKVGKRITYPLQQMVMPKVTVDDWVVFIGNAAHTLHPIAGQGFNLSMRDIATLAECLAKKDISQNPLATYEEKRTHDKHAMALLTNGLIELFAYSLPGLSALRGGGLIAVDNIPFLKNMLLRYAQGFAGLSPDLVCGIPLFRTH